jgi:hypothetical protein
MRPGLLLLAAAGLFLFLPVVASAQWSEDFDSYATGTSMHGVGGWKGWDNNPAFTAYTTDLYARSGPNSVDITPTSDLVHEFSGYSSGVWIVTAWQYIPSSATGQQYFILLNTYADGGPNNWSTELQFFNGSVINDGDGATLPAILDQWVEIRVEIDLDNDVQAIYYGGTLLTQTSWTDGLSGDGALNIGAMDLFSNAASSVYYDDISIEESIPSATLETSWGKVKAGFGN